MDLDELRRRMDAGNYDTADGFDAQALRNDLGSRAPRPDPSQGGHDAPAADDFRNRPEADFRAELTKLGLRPVSGSTTIKGEM